jgi:predicted dehydrogenase
MVGVGVVGYGYWGPNLVRNFAQIASARVVAVSDLHPDRLSQVQLLYPAVRTTTDYRDLFHDPKIDAIVIATQVSSHFELGMAALQAGKHVLIEKPLATTCEQARRLIDEAYRRNLVLMVDHTFIYTDAVQKIKELVDGQHLGQIYYYDAVRINLGLFQHDVNVLWDLAVHDLSIMDFVLNRRPLSVTAIGVTHIPGHPVNMAYLTCFFEDNLIAHFHVNWLAPVKIRRTLLGGSRKMIVYDDLEASEKIKIYDKGITLNTGSESVYQLLVGYRSGDMWAPQLNTTEALQIETRHFVDCIEHGRTPLSDGLAGLRVLRILEGANKSLSRRGQMIDLLGEE